MRSVALRVPTTPGMPYSRATIAECESRPPLSVTIAPSSGSRMLNASVVDSVTSTSPCTMRSNSVGPDDAPSRPFVHTAAGGETAQQVLLVRRLGAAEQLAHRDAGRVHDPADARRKARRVGRRGCRRPERRRSLLGGARAAVREALRELVGGRSARAGDERAHLVEAGVDEVLGVVDRGPCPRGGGRPRARRGA